MRNSRRSLSSLVILSAISFFAPFNVSLEKNSNAWSIVKDVISKVGASSPADIGKCMGPLMGKLNGKADGKLISQLVREELS